MTAELMGWQRHLHLRKETTWGTKDAGNADVYAPFSTYTVATRGTARQAALFTGLRQRRHHRIRRAELSGNLTLPLFGHHVDGKSLAEHLIDWGAASPTSPFLDSYTAELYEADADNKRHLGLRVDAMTLAGDAGSGLVTLAFELVGKTEIGGITPPSLTASEPAPVEFLFDDVAFYLSAEADAVSASSADEAVDLRSFSLRMDNNLRVYHTNSFDPSCVAAGPRDVRFQFSIFKKDDTFDLLRRSPNIEERVGRLVLKGRHLGTAGTGNYTQIEILFDRLGFNNLDDRVGLQELVAQDVDWIALKPSTSSLDVEFVYSLIA